MIKKLLNNNYELSIKENCLDIKYYQKIIGLSDNKIEIIINKKKLIVNGNDLIIKCMDEYEIVIKGTIKSIQFIDE